MVRYARGRYPMFRWTTLLLAVLVAPGCAGSDSGPPPLTAEMPLHLWEHLDDATIVGSEVSEGLIEPVEWRFDEPQPDWKPVMMMNPNTEPVKVERTDDALRVILDESSNSSPEGNPRGRIAIELPQWNGWDWGSILVRARSSEGIQTFTVGFNTTPGYPDTSRYIYGWHYTGEWADVVNDGTVQTYLLRVGDGVRAETWDRLGLWVWASEPATFEVLSVSVFPTEADYADAPAGVSAETLYDRRSVYSHAPGRVEYRVRVPEAGRLDVGLRVLRDDDPVTFDVTATPDGGEGQTLLEETYADREHWGQRSVDLSHLAGQTVTLALGADSERPGTVALWATPTLSGARHTEKPNIVLYIIDGGGAEYMSVYGYNRRTTPNLERLAAEGALFEHAYSNAFWSKPSTTSFMTSLQHSVLGGFNAFDQPMPEQTVTMAQHMHDAGYQTAVLTGNSFAGRRSSLDRGVDMLRDAQLPGRSSITLQPEFWQWREAFPGQPFWVHFQTMDVHRGGRAALLPPFSGLYLEPARRAEFLRWRSEFQATSTTRFAWPDPERFDGSGVDRLDFYDRTERMYSEAMAAQDDQIGELVDRLKRTGEWSNTLFIVAADHGQFETGLVQLEPYPPLGQHTNLRPERTRVPMIFVWPGHIAPGQRFIDPVSMIDMLPTVLDLAELPQPEVMMGQSLAPLLLGNGEWEPRPVILEEVYFDRESGQQRGWIEVIDGRWGASLAINPHLEPPGILPGRFITDNGAERPARLLLYDLWEDPNALNSLHEERPDLVEKYTAFLEARWAAHQALATQFTPGGEVTLTGTPLTSEQLRTLRALGYIR